MPKRKFYACKFRETDRRTYTYHSDREAYVIGDRIIVETDRGPKTVIVAEIVEKARPFVTKPIVGKERVPSTSEAEKGE